MRTSATLVLVSLLTAFACLGSAQLSANNPCCTSHDDAAAGAQCCQLPSSEAPAVVPAKQPARWLPTLLASHFSFLNTGKPLVALWAASEPFERARQRASPRLYLLNATLLI